MEQYILSVPSPEEATLKGSYDPEDSGTPTKAGPSSGDTPGSLQNACPPCPPRGPGQSPGHSVLSSGCQVYKSTKSTFLSVLSYLCPASLIGAIVPYRGLTGGSRETITIRNTGERTMREAYFQRTLTSCT